MKKMMLAAAAVLALLAGPAGAETGLRFVPLGYCQLTSIAASTGLASCAGGGIPAGATLAVITAEAQAIRYRDDGVAPTATVGQPVAVGASVNYQGTLSAIRFIAQTSGGIVNVLFYR